MKNRKRITFAGFHHEYMEYLVNTLVHDQPEQHYYPIHRHLSVLINKLHTLHSEMNKFGHAPRLFEFNFNDRVMNKNKMSIHGTSNFESQSVTVKQIIKAKLHPGASHLAFTFDWIAPSATNGDNLLINHEYLLEKYPDLFKIGAIFTFKDIYTVFHLTCLEVKPLMQDILKLRDSNFLNEKFAEKKIFEHGVPIIMAGGYHDDVLWEVVKKYNDSSLRKERGEEKLRTPKNFPYINLFDEWLGKKIEEGVIKPYFDVKDGWIRIAPHFEDAANLFDEEVMKKEVYMKSNPVKPPKERARILNAENMYDAISEGLNQLIEGEKTNRARSMERLAPILIGNAMKVVDSLDGQVFEYDPFKDNVYDRSPIRKDLVSYSSMTRQNNDQLLYVFTFDNYFGHGDYAGDFSNRSNVKYLQNTYPELFDASMIWLYSGGHGYESLYFHLGAFANKKLMDDLIGLKDYPLLDDSLESEMWAEAEEEVWNNHYLDEVLSIMDKRDIEVTDEVQGLIDDFRYDAENEGNFYWERLSEGPWPSWSASDFVEEFLKWRKKQPTVKENPVIEVRDKKLYANNKLLKDSSVKELDENILLMRLPTEGIIAFEPISYMVYFTDKVETTMRMVEGEIPFFPFRHALKGLSKFWKQPSAQGVLGAAYVTVRDDEIFVHMMATRTGYKKNHINRLILDALHDEFPQLPINFGYTTKAGEAAAKKFVKRGGVRKNPTLSQVNPYCYRGMIAGLPVKIEITEAEEWFVNCGNKFIETFPSLNAAKKGVEGWFKSYLAKNNAKVKSNPSKESINNDFTKLFG